MRITYVIQRYGREVVGGGESFCRSFATHLAARGHEVSVVTGRALDYHQWGDHYPAGTEDVDGVTVHRLPTHPKTDGIVLETLGQLAFGNLEGPIELHYAWQRAQGPLLHTLSEWLTGHQREIDVLVPVTQFYFPATEALLMSKRLHLRTLFHPLAHEDPSLSMSMFDKVFALASAFGFLTEEEEQLVRSRFGSTQPSLVHGVGVDLDPAVAADDAVAELGLPSVPFLCYVGRCDPHKVGDAVEFVRRFRQRHGARLELVVVGPPDQWLRPEPGVRLLGFLSDEHRNAVLARAAALVMPSPFESFSMVLTEAWALGRPAIVNGNCGPLRGQAQRSGGAIPYTDYNEFEAAVLRLLDEATARAMGQAGRRYVEERYRWSDVMDRYEALLERIVPPKAKARPRRVDSSTLASGRSVRWEGAMFKHHSLSEVNRNLAARLVDSGRVSLSIDRQREGIDLLPAGRYAGLGQLPRIEADGAEVTIRHQWPPDLSPVGDGALVVVQPWEFGCIPQEWVDALGRVDEYWVPSDWVRECYLASGVPPDRVVTIPNGVDLDRFTPDGPVMELATAKRTKLLFVGGTIARKGIDVLLSAYVSSFRDVDDVCLVIKGFGSDGVYAGSSVRDVVAAIQAAPGAPEILYIESELDPDQMAQLYRACDVVVHPYRGEGFGLPPAEAMACGLAVVVTAGGPTDEFCPIDSTYRIPAVPTPIAPAALGLPLAAGPMWWLEPDLEALAATMRHVVGHPDEVAELGRRNAIHARSLTWDRSAARVLERIDALSESTSTTPVVQPDRRPTHRNSPAASTPPMPVAVVVNVSDTAGAMSVLEQIEGEFLDGAPFHVVLDLTYARTDITKLAAQLEGAVSIIDHSSDPFDPSALATTLGDAGIEAVVTIDQTVTLHAGWWRLLSDTLTAHLVVTALGTHDAVMAARTTNLGGLPPARTVRESLAAAATPVALALVSASHHDAPGDADLTLATIR